MKTLVELKHEMESRGLSDYFSALEPLAKNSVHITLNILSEEMLSLGSSKFGGHPDLPADVEWFRCENTGIPMSFVAQINFEEIAPFDTERRLPDRGILYFFYDCSPDGMPWGFNPEDKNGWKVYFYNGDTAVLFRKDVPADFEEDDNGMLFECAQLCFESVMELPSPESDLTDNLDLPEDDDVQDAYWEWLDEISDNLSNKLLGHADPVQGGMERECEYVTHQINCGTPDGYSLAKSMGLDKNAARWNLLLQVDSNEDIGMMWGDMGRLYFWITEEDLDGRNFENCWLILQCG